MENFKVENFTPCGKVTEEVIKFVLENVPSFQTRYAFETERVWKTKCCISHELLCDIYDTIASFLDEDNDELWDDMEEVFG